MKVYILNVKYKKTNVSLAIENIISYLFSIQIRNLNQRLETNLKKDRY